MCLLRACCWLVRTRKRLEKEIFFVVHHATENSPWSAGIAYSTKLSSKLAENSNVLTHGSLSLNIRDYKGNKMFSKIMAAVKIICCLSTRFETIVG